MRLEETLRVSLRAGTLRKGRDDALPQNGRKGVSRTIDERG